MVINMSLDIKSLVKGKKALWNFKFDSKVCGRNAQLGGIGYKALTIKLEPSKDYPNLDIKCFLNWEKWDSFTPKEKALVQALQRELDSPLSYDNDCNGDCGGCVNMHDCHDLG